MHEPQQVCFYKRAQIFAGDVWGALKGRGLGAMHEIHARAMFENTRACSFSLSLSLSLSITHTHTHTPHTHTTPSHNNTPTHKQP